MATTAAEFTFAQYRKILEAGLEAGYRFIAFPDLAAARDTERYLCLLRHDCEGDLVAAHQLGELEKRLGISSTFFVQLRSPLYNVLARPYHRFVEDLLALGHRIGLHFDERAHEETTPEELADVVDAERATLRSEFGAPVDVVSFHQPSRRVLDNVIKLHCINTYDRADMAGVGYLSDSRCEWKQDPIATLHSHQHPHIQLLLHPECWTDRAMSVERKWRNVLRVNLQIAQQTLLDREATYKRRARISFRS